jgi:hypothetical protein
VDAASISDSGLRDTAAFLFMGRAVQQTMAGDALKARHIMDAQMVEYQKLRDCDRRGVVRGLIVHFGYDACVRAMTERGWRLPGVEWNNSVQSLGHQPSIRLDGREIYRDRPQLVLKIYNVLTGVESASVETRQRVEGLLGLVGIPGALTLHHHDGQQVQTYKWAPKSVDVTDEHPAMPRP